MKATGVLWELLSTAGDAGDPQDGRGRWAPTVPMKKRMADDGRGLLVNTDDSNKRLETMGTGGFA